MKRILIEWRGISPLMMCRFGDEAAMKATGGSSSSTRTNNRGTPREQAAKYLYYSMDEKTLSIPTPNILRCIVDGGAFHKSGRSKITTKESSLIYACLEIEGVDAPLIYKEPWCVDTRPVRIPATGGRILCNRSMRSA